MLRNSPGPARLRNPVPPAGGAFESVRFSWDPAQLDHVSMISLTAREAGVPPEVLERARAQRGSALRPAATGGHQYNGEGVNLSISSNLYINAHEFEDPRWKERLAAQFTVLRGGAVITKQRHDVGLGHAWFSSAMLQWENAADGKWQSVHLHYPASFDFKAQRAALERCLSAVFGAPKVDVTDHLAGEVTLRFESAKAMLRMYAVKQSIMIFPVRGAKTDTSSSGLRQAIETLASCG